MKNDIVLLWESKLLPCCRPTVSFDPILWLSMTRKERSRCTGWRLGWLPGCEPRSCPWLIDPNQTLIKMHISSASTCITRYVCLALLKLFAISFKPPTNRSSSFRPCNYPWILRWPTIRSIVFELDHLYHHIYTCIRLPHGQLLLSWILKH